MKFALLPALLGSLLLAGCGGGKHPPLATVPRVELSKYAGTWYEIARLPNPFQKAEERAVAEYGVRPDGLVSVKNTAIARDGKKRSIEGSAEPVAGSNNARLKVRFKGIAGLVPVSAQGNYWIIALDREYRHALVGTPDRDYLWLLSRSPKLDRATTDELLAKAKAAGFATERVIWDPAP